MLVKFVIPTRDKELIKEFSSLSSANRRIIWGILTEYEIENPETILYLRLKYPQYEHKGNKEY
jgi:hypothetical protein